MSHPRVSLRWILLAALVLVLALTPFLPRGYDAPSAGRAADRTATGPTATSPTTTTNRTATAATVPTVGYGRLTPTARRTIDRLVDQTRTQGRLTTTDLARTSTARALVDDVVRCAVFEGERYCLGSGWTDDTQAEVRNATLRAVQTQATGSFTTTQTGDRSAVATLQTTARSAPRARADAVRRELTQAARSVAKVWLLRHEIQGVPLPAGFYTRHPEVSRTTSTTVAGATSNTTTKTAASNQVVRRQQKWWRDYPDRGTVLNAHHVREQHRTYWCGPTTMQMIVWGWTGHRRSQAHWASRLGTTTSGSSIADMVRVVNSATGYDRRAYAGPYIVLDISDWSFREWKLLMARHVVDYRAPVVLHPVLLKQYFPYLDHDGSGHFQVGRGYQKRDGKTPLLGYFEPWNQQRFHPDEPFISRVQWRNAYQSYRANQAHFQHNLGV